MYSQVIKQSEVLLHTVVIIIVLFSYCLSSTLSPLALYFYCF